jgi:hypothetical protein
VSIDVRDRWLGILAQCPRLVSALLGRDNDDAAHNGCAGGCEGWGPQQPTKIQAQFFISPYPLRGTVSVSRRIEIERARAREREVSL